MKRVYEATADRRVEQNYPFQKLHRITLVYTKNGTRNRVIENVRKQVICPQQSATDTPSKIYSSMNEAKANSNAKSD